MSKSIRFDIDDKQPLACVTQAGKPDRYMNLRSEVGRLRE